MILSIPLCLNLDDDKIFWVWESRGCYSVKSAYRFLVGGFLGDAKNSMRVRKAFWKLNLPSNIKNFIWRALCNVLPVKMRLVEKSVNLSDICNVCWLGVEIYIIV